MDASTTPVQILISLMLIVILDLVTHLVLMISLILITTRILKVPTLKKKVLFVLLHKLKQSKVNFNMPTLKS